MFITIDGGDGCGKSSQIERLREDLSQRGIAVRVCRDPGSTPLGVTLRSILLGKKELAISPESEMFLFMAARAQMTTEIISPALAKNEVVLADRFLLSTLVYQGFAGGLDPNDILRTGLIATGGLLPDLTILLDIPVEVAFSRIKRNLDRIEERGMEYHQKVRAGFLRSAEFWKEQTGKTVKIVDASQSMDQVTEQIAQIVREQLSSSPF